MSFRNVAIVSVPVTDPERARAFYCDTLGFKVRHDNKFGNGQRWIEVHPPGAQTSITLVTWFDKMPPGSVQGLVLAADGDIEAIHAALLERGVAIDPLRATPWGRNATFSDPDGNGLVLQESKAAS